MFLFDRLGEPTYGIRSCAGPMTTNLADSPDRKRIYITGSETGSILVADAPVPGQAMYAIMTSCLSGRTPCIGWSVWFLSFSEKSVNSSSTQFL